MVKMVNDYTLIQNIGSGAYGQVYKANHSKKDSLFAVKVIPIQKFQEIQKLQQCINNEIKALTLIGDNPHIVKFHEQFKSKSNRYFVYDYCNGGTLQSYIRNHQKLSQKQALKIFGQLQLAFKVLNKFNIMHRDLKPENILFNNGKIKIADFGFCIDLESDDSLAKTMLGSPIYMAPEVLKGHMYTSKTDIWSLGIILFEMLYGKCPYNSKNIFDLISNIQSSEINFPKDPYVSEKTQNLIKKMLQRDSFRRLAWTQLFKIEINEQGQYTEQIYEHSKSISESKKTPILAKQLSIRDEEIKGLNKLQLSVNQPKKASSLPKTDRQKVFYSQNFIQLLSSKNIIIEGLQDESKNSTKNKITQRINNLQRKDTDEFLKSVENKLPFPVQKIKVAKDCESKRETLLKKHENIVKELKIQYENLEANGLCQIQNIYLKLANIQENFRLINNSIKATQLDILDINSIFGYEAIQLDRFMVELRDYMVKKKIEIPPNNKLELNS